MKTPIFTGAYGKSSCHIQGIALDPEKGYLYCSFTTKLVKFTLDGKLVGSVDGLMGHLGCIAFNKKDGRVYGSLEYKNDSIGRNILGTLGSTAKLEDAFYIAIFDVDKIDRMDMSAEKDGIMTSVCLQEVANDYNGTGKNRAGETVPHHYGCSGIDGTTFGPMFGDPDSNKQYLYVCYGIYSDLTRDDNDHQVILCYDTENWKQYERPLSQFAMHHSGPEKPDHKFFLFTGNTNWGVQNLEYDPYTKSFLMAVYYGKKEKYPNYHLFAADASVAPVTQKLVGMEEEGEVVQLLPSGATHAATGLRGWNFPHGATGLYAWGDGRYTISSNFVSQSGQCGLLMHYTWDGKVPFVLED